MHERSLPPSPNWYCSRCSDLNSDGLLGFGGKNIIYLIDVSASSCVVVGEYSVNVVVNQLSLAKNLSFVRFW